jgi:transcriptional regulatory protein RtcR
MTDRPKVMVGVVGSTKDSGSKPSRWQKWRPTISLFCHDDIAFDRAVLLHDPRHSKIAGQLVEDIAEISSTTDTTLQPVLLDAPWDFEPVFQALHAFAASYDWDPDNEDYFFHITTGSHVWQICVFLLTESRHLPVKLLQSSPPPHKERGENPGGWAVIDLDLSRYDAIANRFAEETTDDLNFLKQGIATREPAFNGLIKQLERVAVASPHPILLSGPTGAGKTQLARRLYQLLKRRHRIAGNFVEVNCATLRGDQAMSALFGHVRGSFTGAVGAREGHLMSADRGVLFLDEIGELGPDEQAMLLKAVETGRFHPVGSDSEVESDFRLIAGTNRDLRAQVANGSFRADLLARIDLWHWELPGLADRRSDIEPNLQFELQRWEEATGDRVTMNAEATRHFLTFATSDAATWAGNFRDLNAAVVRMATLAGGERIDRKLVEDEIARLQIRWNGHTDHRDSGPNIEIARSLMGDDAFDELDRFDRVQLLDTLAVCRACSTMSEAGRILFSESRKAKDNPNDSDRVRKYLLRHGIDWHELKST